MQRFAAKNDAKRAEGKCVFDLRGAQTFYPFPHLPMCGRFTKHEPLEFFVESVSGPLDDSVRLLLSKQEQARRYNVPPGTKI